jgi:ParB/RepB/Spo0J family partition protein
MSVATLPAPKNSATNDDSARQDAWKAEIHTPAAVYNANVPCDLIEPDAENRKAFDQDALHSLAAQIAAEGLLQPILLRKLEGGRYRIIAGERRWRAVHTILKRPTIAAMISAAESDLSAVKKQTIENLQREGLNPVELARQFRRLADLKMTQGEIGKLAGGMSQPVVANTLKLLELPSAVQDLIATGELTAAHGLELVRFARHPRVCLVIALTAIERQMPAKDLREDPLPFPNELVSARLVEKINTYTYYDVHYIAPKELKNDPDFVWEDYTSYYILPENPKDNKWAAEKGRQDAARAAKKQKQDSREDAEQAKMTPAEKAARQKKIAENKRARMESSLARQVVLEQLRDTKDFAAPALAVVVQKAFAYHWRIARNIKPAAEALGLTLPKGFDGHTLSWIAKLKPVDMLRLCAAAIANDAGENGMKFAWGVDATEELLHLLGDKKAKKIKEDAKQRLAAVSAARKGGQ